MRIKDGNIFQRVSGQLDVRKKVFVMLEGTKTEPLYFESLFTSKRIENVHFYILSKNGEEEGWSNPKKLFQQLQESLSNDPCFFFSYRSICNELYQILFTNPSDVGANLFQKTFFQKLQIHGIQFDDKVEATKLASVLKEIRDGRLTDSLFDSGNEVNFEELFKAIPYAPDIDQVVLLVDRDKESFTSDQYCYLSAECPKQGIKLVVTNPCFEFFLALHLSDCKEIDQQAMLENAKDERKNTYAFNYLRRLDPTYKKNRFNVQIYLNRFETAKANSKCFESDIDRLRNHLGTNIFVWLEEFGF